MRILSTIYLRDVAVVLLFMFFAVAGSIPGIAPNQASEMTGVAATRLQTLVGLGSQVLVNAAIAVLLLGIGRRFTRYPAVLVWPCLLAAWALLSTVWSQDALLTLRRALPFALATGFGLHLALEISQQKLLQLLRICFALLACWSVVLAMGFPSIGLDASLGHTRDWQGVFSQKNACGRAMVFAVAAVLSSGRVSATRMTMLLLFAAELVLSGSRGAWLLATVVLGAVFVFWASCRMDRMTRTLTLSAGGAAAIAVAALVQLNFSSVAPLLGRDATLTGRTEIWHQVWIAILHHPLLGYGFSAFWRGAQGASANTVLALRFVLFHAHNGFLEIWLELGGVGLALFAAGWLRALFLLWPELRNGNLMQATWPLSVVLLILLYDVDENTILTFNGLYWVLYTTVLAQLELLAIERSRVHKLVSRHRALSPVNVPVTSFLQPTLSPRTPWHVSLPAAMICQGEKPRQPWL